jgi:hypothetical protein
MARRPGERILTSMKDHTLCALHLATGTRDECPAEACAFWEDGGAVVESGCIFERVRLEFEARPDLARWLLQLRYDLENARSLNERRRIGSRLNAVLPPGLHE